MSRPWQELPINIKFCFEGMEESGSEGLDELVFSHKDCFFKDVDYVCISDNYWLGKTKPCITYGLRGICYFFIEVDRLSLGGGGGTFTPSTLVTTLTLLLKGGRLREGPALGRVWRLRPRGHDGPHYTYGQVSLTVHPVAQIESQVCI